MDNQRDFNVGCKNNTFDIKTRFLMEVNVPVILEDNKNEYLDLFMSIAQVIRDNNTGDVYYHVPHFFKPSGENKFEILTYEQLPAFAKDFLENEDVKK